MKTLRRLLPRSILGQLLLTFSLGYLALLMLNGLHAARARQFYILRGMMSDRARQMVSVALLLDMADAADRPRLLERMAIRGMSISLDDSPRSLPPPEDEELARAGVIFADLLNRFLAESRGRDPLFSPPWIPPWLRDRGKEKEPEDKSRDNDDAFPPADAPGAFATVLDISMPGIGDDMIATLRKYAGKRPSRGDPLYHAFAAVPLSDGSWVMFEDAAPAYRGTPDFPFRSLLLTELFFVLIGVFTFWLIVRPLRRLARAADSFGRDMTGSPPVPETGPREVREAAQAFNRMQRRIREFVDERARTLAAVSHDLRTPLTRMRLRVEQLDEKARLPLQKDMDELQQLMDTTIDLARGNDGESQAPVDVAALLESLVEDRQDMGQNVTLRDPDALRALPPLLARPLSVRRCLNNLLENAVRYGGDAVVDVEDGPDELAVIIRDHGPGIPEKDLRRVFEPFYRLEPSRNRSTGGNGLGLAIARSMIRLHGGEITLSNVPGGGLEARVTLPRRERRETLRGRIS